MEEESSSDEQDFDVGDRDDKKSGATKFAPPLPPLPPLPDKVIVKKGYDPKIAAKSAKAAAAASDEMISPLTGGKIPASKVQEHMRIGLLDPRWVEQRDKHIKDKMNQDSVYAPGAAIEASLKQLAERRTDIFGIGDEETAIGKKIGEEDIKKDDKITWDGHTSSVEAATRAARANITIEDQIHQIHKVKGLLPDEEKEKIGPKPVTNESSPLLPVPPLPPTSVKPLIPTLPNTSAPPLPKQPPLPPPPLNTVPAPPQMKPPAPPPPPSIPVPPQPPAPPVVIIPGTQVPPLPLRPPLMMTPQTSPFAMMTASASSISQSPFLGGQQNVQLQMQAMKHGTGDKSDDEPVSKKLRTEESLEPEEDYLMKNKGPVMFKVVCPALPDKQEWHLTGQVIELTLPLTDSVTVLKSKIHDATNMPPGKQKINWEGLFLKDSNTLAYYNISSATVLQLQLKERGGRKK